MTRAPTHLDLKRHTVDRQLGCAVGSVNLGEISQCPIGDRLSPVIRDITDDLEFDPVRNGVPSLFPELLDVAVHLVRPSLDPQIVTHYRIERYKNAALRGDRCAVLPLVADVDLIAREIPCPGAARYDDAVAFLTHMTVARCADDLLHIGSQSWAEGFRIRHRAYARDRGRVRKLVDSFAVARSICAFSSMGCPSRPSR